MQPRAVSGAAQEFGGEPRAAREAFCDADGVLKLSCPPGPTHESFLTLGPSPGFPHPYPLSQGARGISSALMRVVPVGGERRGRHGRRNEDGKATGDAVLEIVPSNAVTAFFAAA